MLNLLIKKMAFFTLVLFYCQLIIASELNLHLSDFENKWSGEYTEQNSQHSIYSYKAYVVSNEAPSYIEKRFNTPVDFNRKFVRVKFKVNDLKKLSGIELRLTSSEEGYDHFFAIPVPFFTDPDFNTVQSNAWMEYTFTMGEANIYGTPDLTNIIRLGFYLGGEEVDIEFRSISIEDAVFDSIISFTWDDGYDDHLLAAEIMGKYGLKGTAYLMPRQIGQENYLKVADILRMRDEFDWGLSSHHKIPIVNFPYEELALELKYTIDFLANWVPRKEAMHFAYPLGKQSRTLTLPQIKKSFLTARLAGGGAETLPPADWHMLRAFNVMPNLSPADLIARVKKAKEQGEWLILMFHYLTDEENPSNPLAYNTQKFEEFCQLVQDENSLVLPVHEVYEAFSL